MKRSKEGLFSFDYNGHFCVYRSVSFRRDINNHIGSFIYIGDRFLLAIFFMKQLGSYFESILFFFVYLHFLEITSWYLNITCFISGCSLAAGLQ
jgi:hypothetical protein